MTRQILNYGGSEANPIADTFIRTPAAWAFKGLFVVVIAFAAAQFVRSQWLVRFFYGVLALYAVVVLFNATQLLVLVGTIL